MKTLQIVLTGASGFLGQHLLSHWMSVGGPESSLPSTDASQQQKPSSSAVKVKIVALYNRLSGFPTSVEAFKCLENVHVTVQSIDLTDATAMAELEVSLAAEDDRDDATFTVVVHTAAMSSPRLCQQDPDKAKAVNVPTHFFKSVSKYPLIVLSTDQVYDGKQSPGSLYKETEQDALKPANAYGQSKLDMETYLKDQNGSKKLFLLRSSIILGPPAPFGGAHETFFDFCKSQGAKQEDTTFFTNEYRTIVSVQYVIRVIDDMILHCCYNENDYNHQSTPIVYNMGGPIRANRWDMAKAVFEHFGYDQKPLLKAHQTSPNSPLDISMDSSLLQQMNFGGSKHEPETLEGMAEYVFS